jgi:hypothetical protein
VNTRYLPGLIAGIAISLSIVAFVTFVNLYAKSPAGGGAPGAACSGNGGPAACACNLGERAPQASPPVPARRLRAARLPAAGRPSPRELPGKRRRGKGLRGIPEAGSAASPSGGCVNGGGPHLESTAKLTGEVQAARSSNPTQKPPAGSSR